MDELRTFLSYVAMNLPMAERIAAIRSVRRRAMEADTTEDMWGRRGNTVSRVEFVRVCSELLWDTPDDVLEAACAAYKAAVTSVCVSSESYWTKLSQKIDEEARLYIPGSFLMCLFLLFGANFEDDYGLSDFDRAQPAGMFEGIGPSRGFHVWAVFAIALVPMTIALFYLIWPRIRKRWREYKVRSRYLKSTLIASLIAC